MGSYSGTCEIVEAGEDLKPVQRFKGAYRPHSGMTVGDKDRKPPVLKLGYKDSLENDINQLFEAINLKGPKGLSVSYQGGASSSSSKKSALKKPIAVGMPQYPRIGGSESLSLKQALRDLCISKASEMAAMKRVSMSVSSPGVSEAGRIKSLFNSVVVEPPSGSGLSRDEDKRSMVEISLVPEESKSTSSRMMAVPHQDPKIKSLSQSANSSPRTVRATTQISHGTSTSRKVGSQVVKTEARQKEKHTSASSPSCSYADNNMLEPDNNVPATTKSPKRASTPKSGRKGRLHAVPSSSSINGNKVSRMTRNAPRVAKSVVRNKNTVKKKIKKDSPSTSASNACNEVNSSLDSTASQLICQRCQCSLKSGSNESNQDSMKSQSAGISTEVSSNQVNSDARKPTSVENNSNRIGPAVARAKKSPKSREKGEFSQSSSSLGDSSSTSISDDSNLSGSSCGNRPHMSKDVRWEAIRHVKMQDGVLGLRHFNLLKKLGCGDIGTVYLAELIGTNCLFAIKVMDNEFLARRKKMPRAQTEREILRMLDHPFLPTLYTQFTSDNLSCLVMEYCPGGDLHVLRQRQSGRCFPEPAARFYVAEVLLALEYLHMLGVVYRDLKPENILVREDGHIMLTDFDLSLRCTVNPTLLKSSSNLDPARISGPCTGSSCVDPFCIEPTCRVPCFSPRILPTAAKTKRKAKADHAALVRSLPQLVAEPTDARSNSFVGTHEYLAPEIIKGDGHGAAVDWWTFGIFLYELLYGRTPFKGAGNEETLANVVLQSLKFPDSPLVSFQARDLIRGLLVKEPENRLGTEKGAAEIKQHPFFEGLNWALIRCAVPPELPEFYEYGVPSVMSPETKSNYLECKATGEHLEFELIEESSYFRAILGGSFSESCLDSISVQWQLEIFLNVVKCMFGCPLDITSKNFVPLLEAALYFGVDMLLLQLKSWFSEVSLSKDPGRFQIQLEDLIHIWNFGNTFDEELCASYLARNFMWAMSSNFFENIPYGLLLLCMKHPDLTVDSEKHLSDALLIWLDSNTEQLERLSETECGFSGILKQIRIGLLPLWFGAGKRSSSSFSELANESVDLIFKLMKVTAAESIKVFGDMIHLRIRLTEYSKRVDLSGCPQITLVILLLSLLPSKNNVALQLSKSMKETVDNLDKAERSRCRLSFGLLPTFSFEAVQEVDISGCLKLHLEAAIECFSKSFPSLRKVKAAYLLTFKTTTLYKLIQKCSLVSEVDITVDLDPLILSQVSVISSSSAVTSVVPNRPYIVGDSSSMVSVYHPGPSLSNITKLTLEGRNDVCDSDIQHITKFCISLYYLNLKGCTSVTDICIANLIRSCTKLHSIVVCHTSFGTNSILALCTVSPSFSDCTTTEFGKKHSNTVASNLQLLHMGGCKRADEASLIELLSQTQMLKSLCLRDTNLVDDALCNFSGSLLEMLDVSNTMVSGAALKFVVQTNPGLKCLNARGCKNLFCREKMTVGENFSSSYTREEPFIELGKTCRLEEIALGWGLSYFSLQDMKPAISSLRAMTVGLGGSLPEGSLGLLPITCPLLEALVLYFQVISDCIIIDIITSLMQLQTLALCYCHGDISISSFNTSMPNLRKLRLERVTPWMTNNDLVLLTQNCVNLVDLALIGCKLLNSDAQWIVSCGWPGLISIHLEDCGEVTTNGVSSLFNCNALENLLLRHNGRGIPKNFIFDAVSKMPMLRQVSLDLCDASEGDFDLLDDNERYSLRSVKIARCKSQRCFAESHTKMVHKETLVVVYNTNNVVRTVVKERL
ncbi:hypothetical protein CCACVL1_12065 [Corchorus capsularis]|uniref:non-specific serine/threonine protein kinase n=1 Tax=Corchorus capsularis TaxID=210143 RepID=A0A1R3IHT0_COCAP|nr:hypothetical protein CCACVL1_12065 [Corchorus capsularis]